MMTHWFFSKRSLRWTAAVFYWLALMTAARTDAHPVAQGALEVRILPGAIEVRARVSTEEVFVASAFALDPTKGGSSLDEVWKTHGDYLLAHLRLQADGQPLAGRVRAVVPPAGGSSASSERVVYELEYPLATGDRSPTRLRLEEDVLKEFTYAPGNPWTASYVVRVEQPGRAAAVDGLLLDRNQPLDFLCAASAVADARALPAEINQGRLVKDYAVHGLFHILTGYDHLLFMGALVLAARTFWDLVKVVSAFTLAHTLTLTLSVLDVVRLPERVVEPMIAASIVFVALQNIFAPARARGWTRLGTAFFFGLFHGLGFAGGLLEAMAGLPAVAIGTAIAAFSLGVELGHQAVVLPVFGALKLTERRSPFPPARDRVRQLAERYGSAAITVLGAVYLVAALR